MGESERRAVLAATFICCRCPMDRRGRLVAKKGRPECPEKEAASADPRRRNYPASLVFCILCSLFLLLTCSLIATFDGEDGHETAHRSNLSRRIYRLARIFGFDALTRGCLPIALDELALPQASPDLMPTQALAGLFQRDFG